MSYALITQQTLILHICPHTSMLPTILCNFQNYFTLTAHHKHAFKKTIQMV